MYYKLALYTALVRPIITITPTYQKKLQKVLNRITKLINKRYYKTQYLDDHSKVPTLSQYNLRAAKPSLAIARKVITTRKRALGWWQSRASGTQDTGCQGLSSETQKNTNIVHTYTKLYEVEVFVLPTDIH